MISIAIDADAVRVIIPLKSLGIFNTLLRKPVTIPHALPTIIPNKVAKKGFIPLYIHAAVSAAPNKKLPSAVKSAKSNTLNVRKIPIANKQQGSPLVNMLNIIFKTYINYAFTFLHVCADNKASGMDRPASAKFTEL